MENIDKRVQRNTHNYWPQLNLFSNESLQLNEHTGKYWYGRHHQTFSCQSGPFKSPWEISRIAWLGAVVSISMTASKKNTSHKSLCAFKAQPASFATAQSQLWPGLYSCSDWKKGEKKKSSAILHRTFAVPSAISRPFYLKYICLYVHLLALSSITGLCTNPKLRQLLFLPWDTIKMWMMEKSSA